MAQMMPGYPPGFALSLRDVIITDMSIYISFWEYLILLPKEFRIWRRLFSKGRTNPSGWFCIILRYLILVEAIVIIENTYGYNFKTDTSCKAVAVIDGMTGILLTTIRSCALAWRANAVASATLSGRKNRFSTLRILQYALLITLAGTIAAICTSFWDFYTHLGGWTSRVDPMTGGCYDPKGVTGPYNGPRSSIFWANVPTIGFEAVCVTAVVLSMRRIKSSWGLSKFVTVFSTHSFGYFALSLALGVILAIMALVNSDVAPIISKPFFTLVNVFVVRIMIQEQSILVKGVRESATGPSNKEIHIPRNGNQQSSSMKSIKNRVLKVASRRGGNDNIDGVRSYDKDLERQQGITIEREEIIDLDCFEENNAQSPNLEHYPSLSRGPQKKVADDSAVGRRDSDSTSCQRSFSNYVTQKDDDASSQVSDRWPGLDRGRKGLEDDF